MTTEQEFPALEIDPRKVERYKRYLLAYAELHAMDPLEHRRREHEGLRFLAAQRRRRSILDAIAQARADGVPFNSKPLPQAWHRFAIPRR